MFVYKITKVYCVLNRSITDKINCDTGKSKDLTQRKKGIK